MAETIQIENVKDFTYTQKEYTQVSAFSTEMTSELIKTKVQRIFI